MSAIYILFSWSENNIALIKNMGEIEAEQSFFQKIRFAWYTLRADKPLLTVGIIESSFKIALALWVFIWTPLLEETNHTYINPGAIYACFMMAKLIGSELFDGLKKILKTNTYLITIVVTTTGCLSFWIDYSVQDFDVRFVALAYFDGLSGILQPLLSSLKSQMIPEKMRTTIMTFFRFPINFCAIITLFYSTYLTTSQICLVSGFFMLIASIMTLLLYILHTPPDCEKRKIISTTDINHGHHEYITTEAVKTK